MLYINNELCKNINEVKALLNNKDQKKITIEIDGFDLVFHFNFFSVLHSGEVIEKIEKIEICYKKIGNVFHTIKNIKYFSFYTIIEKYFKNINQFIFDYFIDDVLIKNNEIVFYLLSDDNQLTEDHIKYIFNKIDLVFSQMKKSEKIKSYDLHEFQNEIFDLHYLNVKSEFVSIKNRIYYLSDFFMFYDRIIDN